MQERLENESEKMMKDKEKDNINSKTRITESETINTSIKGISNSESMEKEKEALNKIEIKDKEKYDKMDEDMGKQHKQNENNINENKDKDKMDIETGDLNKEKEESKNNNEEEDKKTKTPHERSVFSLEGAKRPLSIYTRRVMDISKINNYLKPDSTKGKCGGRNLGNTCFMNSSIACLSNCTELTYYFLNGDYKKDINEENALGMKGDLARSWGELMHQYWVEDTRVGDPTDLKDTIGRKVAKFRGYGQQDSNEFMSYFLDYLNEDLNKITKKEYIEMKEKGDDESDEECSKRFWDCNLKRNDSIITDLFCGQFKSTITCPDCNWINISFDPFDTINLPLLTQIKNRNLFNEELDEFNFFYVPKYCFRNPINLILKKTPRSDQLKDIVDRIKKEKNFIYHDKIDELYFNDMYNKEKFMTTDITDTIQKFLSSHEYIFSYDINKEYDIQICAYFWERDDKGSSSEFPRMIFLKKDMSVDNLWKQLYIYIRKYILSPFIKSKGEKDELSLEIEKYIDDKNLQLNDDTLIELILKEYQDIFEICKENEEKENKMNEDKEEIEKQQNEKMTNEKEEKKEIEMKDININENREITNDDNKNKNTNEEKKDEKMMVDTKVEEGESKNKTKKELIKDFINDLPFKVFMSKERRSTINPDIPLFDKDNFMKISKEFKEIFNSKKFEDTFDKEDNHTKDYKIIVQFNKESKYINEKTFNLDEFDKYTLDYKIKEPKKEGEEGEFSGKMTLEKCLKKFCKEEVLQEGNEWYCKKCKKHVLTKKKMEFFYLPKILIICFKRFVKDSFRWEKNDDEVEFPIYNLDMKDFVIGPDKDHSKYDLFAVSQHYGSTGFGHYTAVCKNDGKWYSYNDSSCSETNENDALSSAAYVLFYRRQTD